MVLTQSSSTEDLKQVVLDKAPVCLSDGSCMVQSSPNRWCGPCKKTHRATNLLARRGIVLSRDGYVAVLHAHQGEGREEFDDLAAQDKLFTYTRTTT